MRGININSKVIVMKCADHGLPSTKSLYPDSEHGNQNDFFLSGFTTLDKAPMPQSTLTSGLLLATQDIHENFGFQFNDLKASWCLMPESRLLRLPSWTCWIHWSFWIDGPKDKSGQQQSWLEHSFEDLLMKVLIIKGTDRVKIKKMSQWWTWQDVI